MADFIIYPKSNGGICQIIPTGEISIQEVARKDVPAGIPYLFVMRDQLPDDAFFDAWEADFSNPNGYGIGSEAWFAEQAAKETQE